MDQLNEPLRNDMFFRGFFYGKNQNKRWGGFAMEKKILVLAMALLLGWVVSASAVPLDLGIFTADLGATVSGNQVLFAESAYSADSGH